MGEIDKYRKHDIVFFTKWNARIFTVIGDTSQYEGFPNVLIDPDFSLVNGRPPHHWEVNNGNLGLLPDNECMQRDQYHLQNLHQNPKLIKVEIPVEKEIIKEVEVIREVEKVIYTPKPVPKPTFPKWAYATHAVMMIIIILLLLKGHL
jgi:hypothetical protein